MRKCWNRSKEGLVSACLISCQFISTNILVGPAHTHNLKSELQYCFWLSCLPKDVEVSLRFIGYGEESYKNSNCSARSGTWSNYFKPVYSTRKLQKQHSQVLKYSSKGDREVSVATVHHNLQLSNCFFGGIIKIIEAQCVLPLARDQEMEEWKIRSTFAWLHPDLR